MRAPVILTATFFSLLIAGCGSKTDGFVPPKVGTQFAWKYVSEGNVDDDLVTVVATGPDFAVFQQSLDDSFFAEFSGIGFTSCDEEYDNDWPSRNDRQGALSAWPLTVGTELRWNKDKILIEKEDVYKIGEQEEPVFRVIHDYSDEESESDRMAISPRYGTALELLWQDDARDFVSSVNDAPVTTIEVQEGYTLVEGLDVTELGKCGKLLTESSPITPKTED